MKFWTGYVWQDEGNSGDPGEALLLQQVRCGGHSFVFAVIGREQSCRRPVRDLKEWFQEEGIMLCRRTGGEKAEYKLLKRLEEVVDDGGGVPDMGGILINDGKFWLFQGENRQTCLFNRRFMRNHVKCLSQKGFLCGRLDRGIGILLSSGSFYRNIPMEWIRQCLDPQEIVREKQIENRLKELSEEGCRRTGKEGCAVYIRTV